MKPLDIAKLLKTNERNLFDLYKEQGQNFWQSGPQGKWTAGQHLIHLVQSTKPLIKALKLPSLFLKWKFGTCNRNARSYDEVVKRYQEKLANVEGAVVSPFSSNMPFSAMEEMNQWMETFSTLNDTLNRLSLKLSEKNLDVLLIPHPLMGKMTLREVLMWNAHHTEHHLLVLNQKYLKEE